MLSLTLDYQGSVTLAMTVTSDILSLRGGSMQTWQATYGSPRCACDDGENDTCLRRLGYFHDVITHFLVTARSFRRSNPLMLSLTLDYQGSVTLAMTFIVEISSLRGGKSPTWQATYGSPRFARDDGWVGGFLIAGHALLAMTFIVEISSLREEEQ